MFNIYSVLFTKYHLQGGTFYVHIYSAFYEDFMGSSFLCVSVHLLYLLHIRPAVPNNIFTILTNLYGFIPCFSCALTGWDRHNVYKDVGLRTYIINKQLWTKFREIYFEIWE